MHLALYTVYMCIMFECNFFLKVKFDSKSRDPLWQMYRTENLFSRPLGYSFSGSGAAGSGETRQS